MNFGAEAAAVDGVFKNVPVVTGRLALPQSEDVSEANQHRHERHKEGHAQRRTHDDEQHEEQGDARADAANQPPEQTALQTPCPAFGVGRGVRVGEAKFVLGAHGRIGGDWFLSGRLEIADADRAVGIEAEDFVEREHCRRSRRDDRAADDGHLALVNVAATDGEAAIDDGGDAKHKPEHHDYGETVADARSQIGGTERRALGESGDGVEREQRGDGKERAKPRADFRSDCFFHGVVF